MWCCMTAVKRHENKARPVYYILDEATNYKVNGLENLLTWSRSYGLRIFLQETHKIWACGRFEGKRAVLKLTFTDRLTYVRSERYRTPDLSLPFKLLGDNTGQKMLMVPTARIELAQLSPPPPQDGVSTNSTTSAI